MAAANPPNVIRRKLVIIGDGACGKTSLLSVFTLGYFPTFRTPVWSSEKHPLTSSQIPTVFENYDRRTTRGFDRWHTARRMVILIGFSVDTPDSLDNVRHKWVEEVTRLCPGVPIILVGLKKDLREDPVAIEEMRKKSLRFVTSQEGDTAAKEIGARKYLECSSLSGEGVDDVFEAATRAALLTFEKGEGGGCCVIL
ncbi:hypothetical protein CGLO_15585 [Colletotrichum gloeosporioides Cg-14]|uniref:Ras family protein n=1 Tax=Colletotrichum gloeosporioides (strain Cg-14) TaxID=1237896 RepID=T0K1E9_COLGC|nr:hypothetical protein CGLO_15585 [Colletotrichum gloeosporioides Cg-14]